MEKILNQLLSEMKEMNNNQNEFNARLDKMDGKFDNINGRLDTIEGKLDRIEVKFDAVYDQTAILTEFKAETEQSLWNIKNSLEFMLHKESENEKEIYLLKKLVNS